MSLTPVENTFTLSASCPQAWQVGVHIEGGLTPAETRTQKHTEAKLHAVHIIDHKLNKLHIGAFLGTFNQSFFLV